MMDEGEKAVLSVEGREMEEQEEEVEESVKDGSGSEEEDDGDDDPEDASDKNGNDKEEDTPQTVDKTKNDTTLPEELKEKKPSENLNVNNEVVKMRKEVKRVRVLIIRKLTRQIGMLKKKKGKEADIERNQRRADRLLQEIHAMKALSPDKVTKTALQKNLNFEQECKNPNSTVSDRAIARIATHPQFNKKINDIKAAVAVFKEDRKRGVKGKEQNKTGKEMSDKKKEKKIVSKKDVVAEEQKPVDTEGGGDGVLNRTVGAAPPEPGKELRTVIQPTEKIVGGNNKREMPKANPVRASMAKKNEEKDVVRNAPKMKEKASLTSQSEEESDLDPSDDEEEKEYFDDSTEERFHKQSSHSDESEDDDFFVGKVSKFKKKKQKDKDVGETNGTKKDQTAVEPSRKEKVTSLDSIFCSSLATSKPGRGRGAGRGRNGERGRGRGDSRGIDGPKGAGSKQARFQEKPFHADRGRGRGRGGVTRKNDRRDVALPSTEPALHPSWEASKKRKEQQGQILAFQGKKIKFDDDD